MVCHKGLVYNLALYSDFNLEKAVESRKSTHLFRAQPLSLGSTQTLYPSASIKRTETEKDGLINDK